jgi:hypothetical protein
MESEQESINYELVYCDCGKKYKIPTSLSYDNRLSLICKSCGKPLYKYLLHERSILKKIELFKCIALSINTIILIAILAELTFLITKPIKIEEPISVEGVNSTSYVYPPSKPIKIEGTVVVEKINHDVRIRKSIMDYP